jgi:superfamily II DNA or RNA helicase
LTVAKLRDYQARAVHDLRMAVGTGHKTPLLVAPTGSGKTVIAGEIIRRARERFQQVLFLAPRRELVYQVCGRLDRLGLYYGVIMAGEDPSLLPSIQVASLATLHARAIQRDRIYMPQANLVLVDEAHIGIGGKAHSIIDHYRSEGAVVIGLTATPARTDGRGLGMIYDTLVEGPTVAQLTAQGHLVPARYFSGIHPDVDGVKVHGGDYVQKDLAGRADDPVLVGKVVENWLRLGKDRQTFVFAVNVAHSRHLCDEFRRHGVAADHIDGETPLEERKAIHDRLESGETRVVCNCQVYTYGVDYPPVSCIVLACPTKSITKYMQMVGRGLRTHAGKADCLVLDHAGAVQEVGFVDDSMPWSLDGKDKIQERKEREKKEPKEIECGDCGEVFRARKDCPSCGAELKHEYRKAIEERDAELQEIERREQAKHKREWSLTDKRRFLGELRSIARQRGYKDGWAVHAYKERIGALPWPVYDAPLMEPSQDTVDWAKHLQIKRAKAREKVSGADRAAGVA